MIKCIAFCPEGFEDILCKDLQEILNKKAQKSKGCAIFSGDKKELFKFAYKCQSIEKVGILLKQGKIKQDPYSIEIKDIDFNHIKNAFSINCSIIGEKPFKSNDVALDVSEKMKKFTGKKAVYKQADTLYKIQIIDDDYYFFLDISSKELSKRDYKIFVNKASLRGTIAYCTARLSEFKQTDIILDPYCKSGEISIEIAHYLTKKSVNFYAKDKFRIKDHIKESDFEKDVEIELKKNIDFQLYATDSNMANLKAAEKNSKIAGINKLVRFSRVNIEDLDLKFRNEIDKVITQIPAFGKEKEKKILEMYREFFEICPKILKKNGTITCIGLNINPALKIAKQNNFKLIHKRNVMQGKEMLDLFIFKSVKE
ncbi:MAG: THUMP domain-containing class I SAM-dependent methyltransferase [Candidatus Woesearchaeota archaeon]